MLPEATRQRPVPPVGAGQAPVPPGPGNGWRLSQRGAGSCPRSGAAPRADSSIWRHFPSTCRPRSLPSGQHRPRPRAQRWQAPGAHMVNASCLRRWARIWQWEGCAPCPAPPLPPLLSRKCISAQAEGEEAVGTGGSRSAAGRLLPRARGPAGQHRGDALGKERQRQEGEALPRSHPWHLAGHCCSMEGLWALSVLLLSFLLLPSTVGSQTSPSPDRHLQTDPEEAPSQHHAARATWEQKAGGAQEGLPPRPRCVHCCEPPDQRFSYPQYQPLPQINMTILKGKFYCYVPGIYYFSLNVHTWNQKETYLHIVRNGVEVVILYAQVSDRSIMQSQSVMLELREQDEVWVRLYKGERENAIFSDEYDTYITFSGHLIKYSGDP
ncbi:complement C1q tumor necrosis factor-related protein 1 isoform 2-T2 [Spheniscus humboldti]